MTSDCQEGSSVEVEGNPDRCSSPDVVRRRLAVIGHSYRESCHLPRVTHHSSLLFVYGTLRRGGKGHDLLERLEAVYLGKGSVAGELLDLGAFPGARKSRSPSARVVGEIYRLPSATDALITLDEYEGVGPGALVTSLFRREITEVRLEKGEQVSAWIYWLNHSPRRLRRIDSGDYATRRKR